jgi:hypothetical protein
MRFYPLKYLTHQGLHPKPLLDQSFSKLPYIFSFFETSFVNAVGFLDELVIYKDMRYLGP